MAEGEYFLCERCRQNVPHENRELHLLRCVREVPRRAGPNSVAMGQDHLQYNPNNIHPIAPSMTDDKSSLDNSVQEDSGPAFNPASDNFPSTLYEAREDCGDEVCGWNCTACTFLNPEATRICEICGTSAPSLPSPSSSTSNSLSSSPSSSSLSPDSDALAEIMTDNHCDGPRQGRRTNSYNDQEVYGVLVTINKYT